MCLRLYTYDYILFYTTWLNNNPKLISLFFCTNSYYGKIEIHLRKPSLPSPPRAACCPPPWVRTAQTASLWCSAQGRCPPGETGAALTLGCMGQQGAFLLDVSAVGLFGSLSFLIFQCWL